MSFIIRRKLSTLIPPKIASAKNLGSAPNAKRMANVVSFYKALPQGSIEPKKATGIFGAYRNKYFNGDNATGKPLLHLAGFVMIFGYSMEYYFHHAGHEEH